MPLPARSIKRPPFFLFPATLFIAMSGRFWPRHWLYLPAESLFPRHATALSARRRLRPRLSSWAPPPRAIVFLVAPSLTLSDDMAGRCWLPPRHRRLLLLLLAFFSWTMLFRNAIVSFIALFLALTAFVVSIPDMSEVRLSAPLLHSLPPIYAFFMLAACSSLPRLPGLAPHRPQLDSVRLPHHDAGSGVAQISPPHAASLHMHLEHLPGSTPHPTRSACNIPSLSGHRPDRSRRRRQCDRRYPIHTHRRSVGRLRDLARNRRRHQRRVQYSRHRRIIRRKRRRIVRCQRRAVHRVVDDGRVVKCAAGHLDQEIPAGVGAEENPRLRLSTSHCSSASAPACRSPTACHSRSTHEPCSTPASAPKAPSPRSRTNREYPPRSAPAIPMGDLPQCSAETSKRCSTSPPDPD